MTNQTNNTALDIVALSDELKKLNTSLNNLELKAVAYALKLKQLNVCKNIFKVIIKSSGCNNQAIINTTSKILSLKNSGFNLLNDNMQHIKNNTGMISLLKCINAISEDVNNGTIKYINSSNDFVVDFSDAYNDAKNLKLVNRYNDYIVELKTAGVQDSITLDRLVALKFSNSQLVIIKKQLANNNNLTK
ncbi:MAG: hypothetical protein E6R13_05780 [Spirochaetes bacterium]|nr:MAG: hypothetical protein E6R13_05780 [Spirochaetota bacterium]